MTELASLPVLGWGSATKVAPIEADDQARGPYFGAYDPHPSPGGLSIYIRSR